MRLEKYQETFDQIVAAADEEDENPPLEACFISDGLFGMIKAVPPELQVRKIEEEEDLDEGEYM